MTGRACRVRSSGDSAEDSGEQRYWQLRTAIEVLKNLEERVDNHAANVVIQLPDTRCGDHSAARIESQTLQQIARIKTVMAQLETWRDELKQERRQCVTQHI